MVSASNAVDLAEISSSPGITGMENLKKQNKKKSLRQWNNTLTDSFVVLDGYCYKTICTPQLQKVFFKFQRSGKMLILEKYTVA